MVKVLVPSGALGLGYDPQALERALQMGPDIIAIDGGSTDSGPSYLGRGVSKYSHASTKIEWKGLMEARARAGVPLAIGTAGTCGADRAVDWMVEITRECAQELGQTVKVAVLRSSQPVERVIAALDSGDLKPLFPAPDLDANLLQSCSNIVALAGAEQIQAALETGADIIIAGRTTDTAIIAALPLMKGCHAGGAWHGAKIGECGALCATDPQSGVVLIEFDQEGFTITPTADGSVATPHTVSAHMLYENSDPTLLHEPGGCLDVSDAVYRRLGNKSVRSTGARWLEAEAYTVKLEGARCVGHQVMVFALLRDRHYVENARPWVEDVERRCRAKVLDRFGLGEADYQLHLRLIGMDATFGTRETRTAIPNEVGVMGFVTADEAATATEIAKVLNPYLLHHPLTREEEQPTFAFQFSPAEVNVGAVYEFCLNHVMHLKDPMEAFVLEEVEFSYG